MVGSAGWLLAGCGAGGDDGPVTGGAAEGADGGAGGPGVGVVEAVVDGDTVDVSIGGRRERVRLIGIDTPEPVGGRREAECYGTEASRRTAELLPVGTQVRLERDAEPRDRYDRLLAYVHRVDGELFVNLDLVADGFADTLSIEPNTTYASTFAAAAAEARRSGLGLWSACGGADTALATGP